MCITTSLAAILAICHAPGGPVEAAAREKLFRAWLEVEVEAGGRKKHPALGWEFDAKCVLLWNAGGEIGPSPLPLEIRIDVSRSPWRLDLVAAGRDGERSAIPGVFKFDRGHLVWATPAGGGGREWCPHRADGEYPSRPGGFASDPKTGSEVRRLRPCRRYDQD